MGSTLVGSSLACKYQSKVTVTDNDKHSCLQHKLLITDARSFIKSLWLYLINNIDGLKLSITSTLVYYLRARVESSLGLATVLDLPDANTLAYFA
jgi:hypothetical protein